MAVLAVGTAVQANTNYGLLCANQLLLWSGVVAVPAEERQLKAVSPRTRFPTVVRAVTGCGWLCAQEFGKEYTEYTKRVRLWV